MKSSAFSRNEALLQVTVAGPPAGTWKENRVRVLPAPAGLQASALHTYTPPCAPRHERILDMPAGLQARALLKDAWVCEEI